MGLFVSFPVTKQPVFLWRIPVLWRSCLLLSVPAAAFQAIHINMPHLQRPSKEETDFEILRKMDCSINSNPHLKTISRIIWELIHTHTFLNFLEMSWIRAEY